MPAKVSTTESDTRLVSMVILNRPILSTTFWSSFADMQELTYI